MCKGSGPLRARSAATTAFKTAFEQLWTSGSGSAEESRILQRHAQGCVDSSQGLEDPNIPLSAPLVEGLAISEAVEGEFCELRHNGVLGSWSGGESPTNVAKTRIVCGF